MKNWKEIEEEFGNKYGVCKSEYPACDCVDHVQHMLFTSHEFFRDKFKQIMEEMVSKKLKENKTPIILPVHPFLRSRYGLQERIVGRNKVIREMKQKINNFFKE